MVRKETESLVYTYILVRILANPDLYFAASVLHEYLSVSSVKLVRKTQPLRYC